MFFLKKYKNRMIVTAVAIILIIIIGVTSTERMSLTKVEKVIGNIFAPIGKFFYNISMKVSDFFASIKDMGRLKTENEELKNIVIELEEQNRKYEDLIGKSDYLKNEAELMKKAKYNLIPAQVIGKEPGNWFNRFVIDKGFKDGIKKDDTVIQAVETEKGIVEEGIVGRVVEVEDNFAKVVSIIDENNKISFKVIRTQDGGIISGIVDEKLSGYLFDMKADVIKGDKLFTSGLGGIYVKDIYIGEIKDVVKNDEDLMKNVYVEPAVDFKKIYRVFVISK
ncbi:rod shape-determining protein MreC [Keratinibaculum paraultunense]|uniref:Cell shape-determining protein MreC n=1 Tax=Keratinibaculum paraultunense TaxID=1278232 RepID=A0A4R3KYN4_9FIRM|nr:rod shape-determining protein MreC [Keratinibaculum paraultunense]QQY80420.1 rod shape-determining protein MreC [Keratinibaculum paraultunense]TCS91136.1 rod shape-determining protein MreC [Keratinibaculum paraultunense]